MTYKREAKTFRKAVAAQVKVIRTNGARKWVQADDKSQEEGYEPFQAVEKHDKLVIEVTLEGEDSGLLQTRASEDHFEGSLDQTSASEALTSPPGE